MTDYCISCKHCRTHIPATQYYCKLNAVERLPESICIWNTKKYPSKFELQVPIHTNMFEEIEMAATSCKNCDNCTPIGCRDKKNSIRDGRFDTKEKCCETRRRETGCPVAIKIKHRLEQERIANDIRQQTLLEVVQKVRHLIREEGYDCGEAERILTFLKEMK